jgi:hypothetical protein
LIEDLEKFEFQIIDYNDFDKFKELLNQRVWGMDQLQFIIVLFYW